ncbi:MAG: TlyA family RNA methyltransferase [Bacilli bacterium]|nr:TlyA family RNA methyltransferase [Bacilli bacterium]
MRLDKELVIRGLVPTRSKAQELISNKYVKLNGQITTKASTSINDSDTIEIISNDTLKYVSRGGLKLDKAINEFNIDFTNKVVMDIGSSTGGFTDCALQYGATKVIGIDVGTDVMVESLRSDSRVELHEQLNIKDATSDLFEDVDIIVSDVSFISIKRVIDKVVEQDKTFDMVLLIKPQFECGKDIADKYKGIILDKEVHLNILKDITKYLEDRKYYINNICASPIKGGDGNIEYLIYVRPTYDDNDTMYFVNYKELIDDTFKKVK